MLEQLIFDSQLDVPVTASGYVSMFIPKFGPAGLGNQDENQRRVRSDKLLSRTLCAYYQMCGNALIPHLRTLELGRRFRADHGGLQMG